MWKRISEYYPNGPKRVLDVGAGSGGAIEFLKSLYPSIEVMAIEQSQIFREYIANKIGIPVLNLDIDFHWPDDLFEQFDLIIFRHTLEHLQNPFSALKQVSHCLTPDGHVYLVVPNAMQLPPECGVRTGYFIPVHINYFNMTTLTRICGRAGLTPTVIKAEKEIWGLFEIEKEDVKRGQSFENSYHAQKEKILREIRARTFYDMKEITKIIAKSILSVRALEILKRLRMG
jgi:SAM-dependent methyltransferase